MKGRGSAGISTSGPENTKSIISRPNIAGSDINLYSGKSRGIKIKVRSARKKLQVKNPKI